LTQFSFVTVIAFSTQLIAQDTTAHISMRTIAFFLDFEVTVAESLEGSWANLDSTRICLCCGLWYWLLGASRLIFQMLLAVTLHSALTRTATQEGV